MSLILGIDTGGTYTDGVIIDSIGKKVLVKAKAFTTKSDLAIGIGNCLEKFGPEYLKNVKLVCLSTTLATNAIVEGKGGKVGLLVTGSTLEDKLPACFWLQLQGKLDIKGKIKEELDEEEIAGAIKELQGQQIEALAISGFASVRNPVHELKIKAIVQKELKVPVVCAHELSATLGFHERTVTSVLNARLIPIITGLICATRKVLAEKEIHAEIMVVKGDGSLMNESSALNKPIETILSGPAASITGGMFLTGKKDALIIDMGGTTTDIANLDQGSVKIRTSGAKVGGWSTQIKAAEICTFGLGGDSYIQADSQGGIKIGPQRVVPLCLAGRIYPYLADEIESMKKVPGYELFAEQEIDCFSYAGRAGKMVLIGQDAEIVEMLRAGPHSAFYLAGQLNKDVESLNLSHLVNLGVLDRISLTPTDILHAMGRFNEWDTRTAKAAVKVLAAKAGQDKKAFVLRVYNRIIRELTLACLQSVVDFERQTFDLRDSKTAGYFFDKAFESEKQDLLKIDFKLDKPIIAVGAPAHAWLIAVSKYLHAQVIIPEHAEVANAIGAAVGRVMETAEALIRPEKNKKGYILHMPHEVRTFLTLQEAREYALPHIREYVTTLAKSEGSGYTHTYDNIEEVYIKSILASEDVYVETRIRATAVGSPMWKK